MIGQANDFLKFIYSEKATKFCEISIVDLTCMYYIGQMHGGDFAIGCKMCIRSTFP